MTLGAVPANSPEADRDPREVFSIVRHDGHPKAHGDTSDEEINVANRFTCAA